VVALEAWLREQRARVSGQSKIGQAMAYSLTRWVALTRFFDDGRICMSNNAGKNWTFAGSGEGGHRAAAIYTLIQTARLNDVDQHTRLADVLRAPPGLSQKTGGALLFAVGEACAMLISSSST
jgi:transposase